MTDFIYNPHDPTYKTPFGCLREGDSAQLMVRVLRRDAAFSVYLALAQDGQTPRQLPMKWLGMKDGYDEYACELIGLAPGLYWYWFEQDVCGDRNPFGKESPWQLTVYSKDYSTPEWFDSGVTYHIFVDRFHRAGEKPEPKAGRNYKLHEHWGEAPDLYPQGQLEQNFDFFGGNLKGILEKLDYIQSLGVTTIYLSPIFESASNHRYDTGDYLKIDPIAGDENDFRELYAEAGKRGMHIMLDGVFNHTGSDSRYFNAKGLYDSLGAAQSKDSPYYGWYSFRRWPDDYDCWWGVKTLPQTNEQDEGFLSFTLTGEDSVIRHWLNAGAAGWRLDVADELPREYLERLRSAVKEAKPDAVIIGEVWEDASAKMSYGQRRRYLQGRELDGVTNYPARAAILEFVAGKTDAEEMVKALMTLHGNYPKPARRCMMNILGTHDTARALNVLGAAAEAFGLSKQEKAERGLTPEEYERGRRMLKLASALQYMLPGSPCLYYGDEAGLTGFEDPLNRRCYPWGGEDGELLSWYRELGKMRSTHRDVFSKGSLEFIALGNDAVAVTRRLGVKAVTAVVNRGPDACRISPARGAMSLAGSALWDGGTAEVPPQSAFIYYTGEGEDGNAEKGWGR